MSSPTPPEEPKPDSGEQPTQALPPQANPPHPNPPPPAGAPAVVAGDPLPDPAEDEAAASNRKQLTGFKIATVSLAVLSVLLLIFGFTLNSRYNDLQAQTDAEVTGLEAQISALEADESRIKADDAEKIAAAKANIKKLAGEVKAERKALKAEDRQLDKAHREYEQFKAQAAQEGANLQTQLDAANAEADLAKHCAAIAYSALVRVYEDFNTEAISRVGRQLDNASAQCADVVQTYGS